MALIDWIIVTVFLIILTSIGFLFSKKNKNNEDYFLGGRSMPMWLVSFAAVGTSISAGTFVGAPQISFDTNMTYLMLSVGAIFGGIFAAYFMLPTLYKANTITIYGYLDKRFGGSSRWVTSIIFLLGQLLTSGSRLFIAAIAVSVMLFNNIYMPELILSIVILGVVSTIYTVAGGIKGLIYIDTLQVFLIIGSGIVAIILLYVAIPAPFSEIIHAIQNTTSPDGETYNKLKVIDLSFSWKEPYTLISAIFACGVFKFAQYSTDQEFVQRQLTTKSAKKGAVSLILSQIISLPIVFIFMVIGLLLYIFYSAPQIMGELAPLVPLTDSRQVFPQYIFNNIPSGVIGLMMVGLLAAALSSFNSAINGMTSSLVSDIYIPIKEKRNKKKVEWEEESDQIKSSRILAALMGIVLTVFAIVTAMMQEMGGQSLVDFALGIMSFSYAGMLGVFLCAVLTKRGNAKSVIAALLVGILTVLMLQPGIAEWWSPKVLGFSLELAWPWWTVVGGSLSFIVCTIGKSKK